MTGDETGPLLECMAVSWEYSSTTVQPVQILLRLLRKIICKNLNSVKCYCKTNMIDLHLIYETNTYGVLLAIIHVLALECSRREWEVLRIKLLNSFRL